MNRAAAGKALNRKAIQEYFESVREAEGFSGRLRDRALMQCQAELLYQIKGGAHCEQCKAPVRHAIRVNVHNDSGEHRCYDALCTRCLVAEEATAQQVVMSMDGQDLMLLMDLLREYSPKAA